MPEFTIHQQLLSHIRKTYCGGNAAELARKIEKDGSYVNRLFYPVGKPGGKGVGLEIMQACTKAFGLPIGFWESNADELAPESTQSAKQTPPSESKQEINHSGNDSFFGWPFGQKIRPWQYNTLTAEQKDDVEKYVLLQINARDSPAEQIPPANNEQTGTHA